MDFRGQTETPLGRSMGDGADFSVNNDPHMTVCEKRALYQERQAGWHRRKFPVPAQMLGWDFLFFQEGLQYETDPRKAMAAVSVKQEEKTARHDH